jgi:hypothetical protein
MEPTRLHERFERLLDEEGKPARPRVQACPEQSRRCRIDMERLVHQPLSLLVRKRLETVQLRDAKRKQRLLGRA